MDKLLKEVHKEFFGDLVDAINKSASTLSNKQLQKIKQVVDNELKRRSKKA